MYNLEGLELAFMSLQMAIALYGIVWGIALIYSLFDIDRACKIGGFAGSFIGCYLIASGIYALLLFIENIKIISII